jgi:hypothetical protein
MPPRSQPGPGSWAPWSTDPDPPQKEMSEEELEAFAAKAKALLERKQAEDSYGYARKSQD